MVALPQPVDVEKQAGQGGNAVLIPQGQYQAVVVASEMKDTKTGGQMIVFTIVVTQGEYANTEFKEYCNVINNNSQTVEIAYQTIANMGKATGLANIQDSSDLHNKALMIEIKTKPAKDWINDKGETVAGKEMSEIKKYLPIPKGGVPAQTAAAPVEAQPEVQAEQPAAANPFAKP